MKEKIKNINIREFENTHLIIDVLFYSVFILIGYMLINFSYLDDCDAISYIPEVFFALGFFSILAYFLNRRKNNYEFLMFGLINVITATYIVVNIYYKESFILCNAILLYTIATVLNKSYHARLLLKEKNIYFIPKCVVTILLVFLGICAMFILPDKMEVANLLFGYYLIGFGLVSLFDPLLCIVFNDNASEKQIRSLLKYDAKEKEEHKENKKLKEVKKKKIATVEVKEEREETKQPVVKKETKKKLDKKKNTK